MSLWPGDPIEPGAIYFSIFIVSLSIGAAIAMCLIWLYRPLIPPPVLRRGMF